ncbi:hypothetical protein GCM10010532_066240 [Dactylosporangium siamense]
MRHGGFAVRRNGLAVQRGGLVVDLGGLAVQHSGFMVQRDEFAVQRDGFAVQRGVTKAPQLDSGRARPAERTSPGQPKRAGPAWGRRASPWVAVNFCRSPKLELDKA